MDDNQPVFGRLANDDCCFTSRDAGLEILQPFMVQLEALMRGRDPRIYFIGYFGFGVAEDASRPAESFTGKAVVAGLMPNMADAVVAAREAVGSAYDDLLQAAAQQPHETVQ